jgi:hypothetical protein
MTERQLAELRAEWKQLSCSCEQHYGEPLFAEIHRLRRALQDQQALSIRHRGQAPKSRRT